MQFSTFKAKRQLFLCKGVKGVHLNEVGPNDALVHVLLALLVTVDFLRQVTAPAVLHDDAQLRVALQSKRM